MVREFPPWYLCKLLEKHGARLEQLFLYGYRYLNVTVLRHLVCRA